LIFGSGPIKGFATTLLIGIAASLFTALFITKIMVDFYQSKRISLTFVTNLSKGLFKNSNFDFLKRRKIPYILSGIMFVTGIGSLLTLGLNQGVDFVGGRTYTVRFDKSVNSGEI